jgi:tartrate dehydratase beta subunit/fumarate hydratase class I family protein
MSATARDKLHRRIDEMTEAEASRALDLLDRGVLDAGDHQAASLEALVASAPADDEPVTAEDEAAIAEARAEMARGEAVPLDQARRELLG